MSTTNIAPTRNRDNERHVHTYARHPSRKGYSTCLGPDCFSIIETKLLVGKRNRCKCGTEFFLTREDLRRAVPRCIDCSSTKAAKRYQKGKQLYESLLGEDSIPLQVISPIEQLEPEEDGDEL